MVWVAVGWRAGMSMPGNLKAASLNRKNRKKCFSSFYFGVFIFKRISTTDASWNESPVLVYQRWAEINNVEHSRCMLSTCVWTSSKTQMDPHTHTHTHLPITHTHSLPLCTSYSSLSGFETWSVGCLVTEAWFSGSWSYPSPTTPLPFILSLNELFFPLQSQGFKRQEDACRGGNTHVAHTRPGPKQFESKQGNVEKFPGSRHACSQIESCFRW